MVSILCPEDQPAETYDEKDEAEEVSEADCITVIVAELLKD